MNFLYFKCCNCNLLGHWLSNMHLKKYVYLVNVVPIVEGSYSFVSNTKSGKQTTSILLNYNILQAQFYSLVLTLVNSWLDFAVETQSSFLEH